MGKLCQKCELNPVQPGHDICDLCKSTQEKSYNCGKRQEKLSNYEISKYNCIFDISEDGFFKYLLLKGYKIATENKTPSTVFDYKNTLKHLLQKDDFLTLYNNVEKILNTYTTDTKLMRTNIYFAKEKHVLQQLKQFKDYIQEYQS